MKSSVPAADAIQAIGDLFHVSRAQYDLLRSLAAGVTSATTFQDGIVLLEVSVPLDVVRQLEDAAEWAVLVD